MALTSMGSQRNWTPKLAHTGTATRAPMCECSRIISSTVTMAAVGFVGLLVVIMRSEEVKAILFDLVRLALSLGGS